MLILLSPSSQLFRWWFFIPFANSFVSKPSKLLSTFVVQLFFLFCFRLFINKLGMCEKFKVQTDVSAFVARINHNPLKLFSRELSRKKKFLLNQKLKFPETFGIFLKFNLINKIVSNSSIKSLHVVKTLLSSNEKSSFEHSATNKLWSLILLQWLHSFKW